MRLIQCLRESVPEAGDAHKELADSLQVALNGYVPENTSLEDPKDERGSKEKEGGNGIDSEFVDDDPKSVLIRVEDRTSRSTLTVEHPIEPSKQGTYVVVNCISSVRVSKPFHIILIKNR